MFPPRITYLAAPDANLNTSEEYETITAVLKEGNKDRKESGVPEIGSHKDILSGATLRTALVGTPLGVGRPPSTVVMVAAHASRSGIKTESQRSGDTVVMDLATLFETVAEMLARSNHSPMVVVLLCCNGRHLAGAFAQAGVNCIAFTGDSWWNQLLYVLGCGSNPAELLNDTATSYAAALVKGLADGIGPRTAHKQAVQELRMGDGGLRAQRQATSFEFIPAADSNRHTYASMFTAFVAVVCTVTVVEWSSVWGSSAEADVAANPDMRGASLPWMRLVLLAAAFVLVVANWYGTRSSRTDIDRGRGMSCATRP